jgi:hypothetical protein
LAAEHQPTTETESILINTMAESHWLANRAQTLQNTCFDPQTGQITDPKLFSLYLRYQTTHTRAFHKSLNDLLKLRAESRKTENGFEAQARKEEELRIKNEQHEMKKQTHYWEVLKKDAEACFRISQNPHAKPQSRRRNPGFEAQYAAELAKHGLQPVLPFACVPLSASPLALTEPPSKPPRRARRWPKAQRKLTWCKTSARCALPISPPFNSKLPNSPKSRTPARLCSK